MAKQPKTHNLDPKRLAEIRSEILEAEAEIASLKGAHAKKVADVKTRISNLLEQVPSTGFRVASFKHDLKEKKLEDKLRAHRESAEADVREGADEIRKLLGQLDGTPLGASAMGDPQPEPPTRKGRGSKNKTDMSAAAKADAINLGAETQPSPTEDTGDSDVVDLRSRRQKEREEERKAEAAERLASMKPLDDPQPPAAA